MTMTFHVFLPLLALCFFFAGGAHSAPTSFPTNDNNNNEGNNNGVFESSSSASVVGSHPAVFGGGCMVTAYSFSNAFGNDSNAANETSSIFLQNGCCVYENGNMTDLVTGKSREATPDEEALVRDYLKRSEETEAELSKSWTSFFSSFFGNFFERGQRQPEMPRGFDAENFPEPPCFCENCRRPPQGSNETTTEDGIDDSSGATPGTSADEKTNSIDEAQTPQTTTTTTTESVVGNSGGEQPSSSSNQAELEGGKNTVGDGGAPKNSQ